MDMGWGKTELINGLKLVFVFNHDERMVSTTCPHSIHLVFTYY